MLSRNCRFRTSRGIVHDLSEFTLRSSSGEYILIYSVGEHDFDVKRATMISIPIHWYSQMKHSISRWLPRITLMNVTSSGSHNPQKQSPLSCKHSLIRTVRLRIL